MYPYNYNYQNIPYQQSHAPQQQQQQLLQGQPRNNGTTTAPQFSIKIYHCDNFSKDGNVNRDEKPKKIKKIITNTQTLTADNFLSTIESALKLKELRNRLNNRQTLLRYLDDDNEWVDLDSAKEYNMLIGSIVPNMISRASMKKTTATLYIKVVDIVDQSDTTQQQTPILHLAQLFNQFLKSGTNQNGDQVLEFDIQDEQLRNMIQNFANAFVMNPAQSSQQASGTQQNHQNQQQQNYSENNPDCGPHFGVVCDGCNKYDFMGQRHRCNICRDFDLCENCFSNPATDELKNHLNSHNFRTMLLKDRRRYCCPVFGRRRWQQRQGRKQFCPMAQYMRQQAQMQQQQQQQQKPEEQQQESVQAQPQQQTKQQQTEQQPTADQEQQTPFQETSNQEQQTTHHEMTTQEQQTASPHDDMQDIKQDENMLQTENNEEDDAQFYEEDDAAMNAAEQQHPLNPNTTSETHKTQEQETEDQNVEQEPQNQDADQESVFKWKTKLDKLEEMGFNNKTENIRLLEQCNGDVNQVALILLGYTNN